MDNRAERIQGYRDELFQNLRRAYEHRRASPDVSLGQLRQAAEGLCHCTLLEKNRIGTEKRAELNDLINRAAPFMKGHDQALHALREWGNKASHAQGRPDCATAEEATAIFLLTARPLRWLCREILHEPVPDDLEERYRTVTDATRSGEVLESLPTPVPGLVRRIGRVLVLMLVLLGAVTALLLFQNVWASCGTEHTPEPIRDRDTASAPVDPTGVAVASPRPPRLAAVVVPMKGQTSAPVRDRPSFDGTKAVDQLMPGTNVELGQRLTTPGKNRPDGWYEVVLSGGSVPLGWMHEDLLLSSNSDGPKVSCERCRTDDAFCTSHCRQSVLDWVRAYEEAIASRDVERIVARHVFPTRRLFAATNVGEGQLREKYAAWFKSDKSVTKFESCQAQAVAGDGSRVVRCTAVLTPPLDGHPGGVATCLVFESDGRLVSRTEITDKEPGCPPSR